MGCSKPDQNHGFVLADLAELHGHACLLLVGALICVHPEIVHADQRRERAAHRVDIERIAHPPDPRLEERTAHPADLVEVDALRCIVPCMKAVGCPPGVDHIDLRRDSLVQLPNDAGRIGRTGQPQVCDLTEGVNARVSPPGSPQIAVSEDLRGSPQQ